MIRLFGVGPRWRWMITRLPAIRLVLAATLSVAMWAPSPITAAEPATDHSPLSDGWPSQSPVDAGLDLTALAALERYAFPPDRNEETRLGIRTNGLVVVRNGVLIYERYAGGYDATTPHLTWSVSKSFVQSLYGVAIERGLIDEDTLDEPLTSGTLGRADWRGVTIRHLLWMASGLAFNETYENSPLNSSVMAMLYGAGSADMAGYAAGRPWREAGSVCPSVELAGCFYYSSGDSNILMALLRDLIGSHQDYESFPWEGLFAAIGMRSVVFEADATGTFVGSSYVYATPRDLARWGQLYLNDGLWGDQRLLPAGWADQAAVPNPAYVATCGPAAPAPPARCRVDPPYGAQWWTNRPVGDGGEPFWPNLPADLYAALGHWGQKVYLVPSRDLLIVRTADDRDDSFDDQTFLGLAMAAFTPGGA